MKDGGARGDRADGSHQLLERDVLEEEAAGAGADCLEHGADELVRQSLGFAPIHEAALLGRVDLIELLLAHRAEIDARANDGRTALSEAVRGGHQEAVTLLRGKGANPGTITADLTKEPKG